MSKSKTQKFKDIEEGMIIISTIEEKIIALNNISSKDFLFLNNIQKKYYNNIRTIAEKIAQVKLEISDHKFKDKIFNSLFFVKQIREKVKDNQSAFFNILSQTNDISLNRSLLEITTYSFKQSIISLKLISTSNRIDMISENNEKAGLINELWRKTENSIYNIEIDCKGLKVELKQFNNNIEKLSRFLDFQILNFEKAENTLSKTALGLEKWDNFKEQFIKEAIQIKDKIEFSFKNFDNIIINLQYHDIIRQKMEHIQVLLKELKLELSNYKPTNKKQQKATINTKYLARVSEISKIQISQLLSINNEFQSATINIVQKLLDTSEKVSKLQKPILDLQTKGNFDEIIDTLNKYQKYFKQPENSAFNSKDFIKLLENIKDSFKPIEARYSNIADNLKNLLNNVALIIDSLEDKRLWKINFYEITSIIEQEVNKLQITLLEINTVKSKISDKCLTLIENMNNRYIGTEIFQIEPMMLEKEFSTINSLENILKSNNKKLKLSTELVSKFASNLEFRIDNIHYFEYYDKSIKEIISGFNQIVEILNRDEFINRKSSGNVLEKLKDNYTVESEHKIHNEVIGTEITNNKMDKEDVDGVELF
ncbi:MAG: hypothetical protein GXO79_12785 [Chlorobi bacterium]|nr:hypothetical protein [Chlorobiota bacterium]